MQALATLGQLQNLKLCGVRLPYDKCKPGYIPSTEFFDLPHLPALEASRGALCMVSGWLSSGGTIKGLPSAVFFPCSAGCAWKARVHTFPPRLRGLLQWPLPLAAGLDLLVHLLLFSLVSTMKSVPRLIRIMGPGLPHC